MATAVEDIQAPAAKGAEKKPSRKILVGKPFDVGGIQRNIYRVTIDGEDSRIKRWAIENNSAVFVDGEGLRFFGRIGFLVGGNFYKITKFVSTKGPSISFIVPNYSDKISPGSIMRLVFVQDTLDNPNTRFLENIFLYGIKDDTDEQGKPKSQQRLEAENAEKRRIRSEVLKELKPADNNSGSRTVDEVSQKPALTKQDVDDFDDGEEAYVPNAEYEAEEILPETLGQSAELTVKYLNDNPELIADVAVRSEVLGALTGGEEVLTQRISSMSAGGQAALQSIISASVSGSVSGTASAQLQSAMRVLGTQVSGSASVNQNVSVLGGVSSQTNVSGSVTSQVSGGLTSQAQVTGSAGGQSSAEIESSGGVGAGSAQLTQKVSAEANIPAGGLRAVSGSISSELETKSLNQVGGHLKNNPSQIASGNPAVRNEIISALGNGDIGNLGPEARGAYNKTLQNLSQPSKQVPESVSTAAKELLPKPKVLYPELAVTDEEGVEQAKKDESPDRGNISKIALDGIRPPAGAEKTADEEIGLPPKGALEILERLNKNKLPGESGGLPGFAVAPRSESGKSASEAPGPVLGPKTGLDKEEAGQGEGSEGADADKKLVGREPGEKLDTGGTSSPLDEPLPENQTNAPGSEGQTKPEDEGEAGDDWENPYEDNKDPGEEGYEEDVPVLPGPDNEEAKKTKEALIKEAADVINPYLNGLLTDAAIWVWTLAIPSLGTSILLGAFIGDLLWIFKKRLVRMAMGRALISKIMVGKEFDSDEVAEQVKFSAGVKANIIAMNAFVAVVAIVLLMIIIIVGCNWPLPGRASVIGISYPDVCNMLPGMTGSSSPGI